MAHEVAVWEASEPRFSQGQQRLEAKSEGFGAGAQRGSEQPGKETNACSLHDMAAGHQGAGRGPWWERLTGAEAGELTAWVMLSTLLHTVPLLLLPAPLLPTR